MHSSEPRETYLETLEGTKIHCRTFSPPSEGKPDRSVLFFTHGMESHSGWFENSARQLASLGHPVVAIDRPGCGKSEGRRGHMDSYEKVIEALGQAVETHRRNWPGKRAVFLGLSLGGLFALALAIRKPRLVEAVVAMAPAVAMTAGFSKMKYLDLIVSGLAFPNRLHPLPISDDMLTSEAKSREFLRNDPLRTVGVSTRFLLNVSRLRGWVHTRAPELNLPLLTLLAERDQVVDNGGIRRWLGRTRAEPNLIREYPEARHCLLMEPCKEQVLEDIETFVSQVEAS